MIDLCNKKKLDRLLESKSPNERIAIMNDNSNVLWSSPNHVDYLSKDPTNDISDILKSFACMVGKNVIKGYEFYV
jgi:hypothetical protein